MDHHNVKPLQTRAPCEIHEYHSPHSHINEHHHIWPLGWGGPDAPTNRIVICATGHNSVHALLDAYRRAGGPPGWDVLQHYGRAERHLADRGWQASLAR